MSVADLSAELSPAVRRRVLIHAIVFVLASRSSSWDSARRSAPSASSCSTIATPFGSSAAPSS